MNYVDEFLTLVKSMNDQGVDYVIIGGAALNVHGLVRATEDVDVFIAPEASNVERLKAALRAVWEDPSIDEIVAGDLLGDYPVIRYGPPEGTLYVDILTRIGEVTKFDDLRWESVEIGGVSIRVATPHTLFLLKRSTLRSIDRADADRLAKAFGFDEED